MSTTTDAGMPLPANAAALRQALLDDHHHLDVLFSRVTAQVEKNDAYAALEQWRVFEPAVLAHMDTEEMYLLPRFAELDANTAARLRDEHAAIRAELGRVALGLELNRVDKAAIEALDERLARHAESENVLMYAWASRELPERMVWAILRRLRPAG